MFVLMLSGIHGYYNLTSLLSDLADTTISSSGVRPAGLMTEVRLYGQEGSFIKHNGYDYLIIFKVCSMYIMLIYLVWRN